jgi:hypothetical protein
MAIVFVFVFLIFVESSTAIPYRKQTYWGTQRVLLGGQN